LNCSSLYSVDKCKVITAYTVKNNCNTAGEHLNCSLYSVDKLKVITAYTAKDNCKTAGEHLPKMTGILDKIRNSTYISPGMKFP